MAEIDIQEKKRGSPWPWILGLLALLLIIWAAMEMLGDDEDDVITDPAFEEQVYEATPAGATDPMNGAASAVPAEVAQFEQQCGTADASGTISTDHAWIDGCVTQLSAALNAVIQRDTVNGAALAPTLEEFRARAERLTENAQSLEHSSYVKQVFEGAASLVSDVEQSRGMTAGAASRVQEAASAVSTSQAVTEQKDAINAFFSEMATALRSMATG